MRAAARLPISGPIGRHRLLPIRRRRHHLPHRRPQPPRVANRHRAPAQPEGVDRGGAHPIRRHSDLRNGSQGCAHLIDPRTGRASSGIASVSVIEASLTGADIDATAAYVHGRDAVRWLQDRPIRSALIVWADGTTTRLPADLITNSQHD